jgi:hypothetical protein
MLAIIYSIDLKFPKCVIFLSQNRDEFFLFLYFCFFVWGGGGVGGGGGGGGGVGCGLFPFFPAIM